MAGICGGENVLQSQTVLISDEPDEARGRHPGVIEADITVYGPANQLRGGFRSAGAD